MCPETDPLNLLRDGCIIIFFILKESRAYFGSQSFQVTVHHSREVMATSYIASAFRRQREMSVCSDHFQGPAQVS